MIIIRNDFDSKLWFDQTVINPYLDPESEYHSIDSDQSFGGLPVANSGEQKGVGAFGMKWEYLIANRATQRDILKFTVEDGYIIQFPSEVAVKKLIDDSFQKAQNEWRKKRDTTGIRDDIQPPGPKYMSLVYSDALSLLNSKGLL